MSDEKTLTQLAGEVAQLRQQLEGFNQRLDMIYGALTRLAEGRPNGQPSSAGSLNQKQPSASSITPHMMMNPAGMLDALRQHATNSGLAISTELMERLKAELPGEG